MIKIHNSESVVLGPMTGENSFTDITIVIDTAGSAENMQAALVFKTVYLVGETFLYSQTVHHASYLNGD